MGELNGDLSHYIYRGWTKGPYIEKILSRLGHTHQRMARVHGDLSSEVENLKKDWELDEGSVTQESFNLVKKALSNGLTSRAVVGEAGPIHLVKNSLATNDRLVPLFKFMACWRIRNARKRSTRNTFSNARAAPDFSPTAV